MLPEIAVYMALRASLGVLIIAAAFIGVYNVLRTIFHGEPFRPDEIEGPEGQP